MAALVEAASDLPQSTVQNVQNPEGGVLRMATYQERKNRHGKRRVRAIVRLEGFPVQSRTFERKTDAKLTCPL